MHKSDFEAPPLGWSLMSIIGGIFTAIALIVGIEMGANRLRPTAAESVPNPSSTAAQPESSPTAHQSSNP